MPPDPSARTLLLARLPAAGFVPPEDAAPWSLGARSARFAAAVEAFAAAYWSRPPNERCARFNQLWAIRIGAGAARLCILGSGLDLEPTGGDGNSTPADVVRTVLRLRPPLPDPLPGGGFHDDPPFDDPTPVTPDESDPEAMAHSDARWERLAWLELWLTRVLLTAFGIALLVALVASVFS